MKALASLTRKIIWQLLSGLVGGSHHHDDHISKKRLSEKLIEGMTPHTAHTDKLATTSERDWGSYSENVGKADNFLIQKDDVFGASRIEALLKMG